MHDSRKTSQIGKSRNFSNYKKPIKNFLLTILILSVLFFPQFYGNLIGSWIYDFFGTIITYIESINPIN